MINAQTAKRKAILNTKALNFMSNIESQIEYEVSKGSMKVIITHHFKDDPEGNEILDAVKEKLIELGYSVKLRFAEPIPYGCPTDQWDYNNGNINISWE